MVYLWDLPLVQPLKVNDFENVLMIPKLCSTDVTLMRYLHCFLLLIMQINSRSMSSKHPNIKFSIGKEKDCCLPFWMLTYFVKTINLQLTFSGVYTIFKTFITEICKIGLIKLLLFWCFSLCSGFIKFHDDIDKLKSILYKNS